MIAYEDDINNPVTYVLKFDGDARPEDVPEMLMGVLDRCKFFKEDSYQIRKMSEGSSLYMKVALKWSIMTVALTDLVQSRIISR